MSTKRWECIVCGYVHEGDSPPDECPVCGAGPDEFELLDEEAETKAVASDAEPAKSAVTIVDGPVTWHKVAEPDELPEGRVKTVSAGNQTFALTHFEGRHACLDNKCPHQGGPLGEGSIENGLLRCPWHGWDFHPTTGESPGDFDDKIETFPCDARDDGVFIGLVEEKAEIRTVSDVLVETMVNWGVTHVFGMVGHSNLGFAEAVRKQETAGKLRFIGIRHEGAAAFAASAYAKLTGRPAACLSIAGPGATNLLTGLWDAKVDRAPVLALTGQVDAQVLGPGAFQELDLAAAFQAVASFSQTVLHTSNHAELMTLALKHATLERDVAHLILPDEIQVQPVDDNVEASAPTGRMPLREIEPPAEALSQSLDWIRGSKRPAIIVGHGARFRMAAIKALAERLSCPVITTFKAKGVIADHHPLGCGVLGRSGTPIASHFMNEADLLIVLGASFSNHTGITSKIPTIQVDYDPLVLGKFHPVTVPVWGEIGVTVVKLLERLGEADDDDPWVNQRDEIAKRWKIWRDEKLSREVDDRGNGISSAAVFAAMNRHVPEDAVIAVDVGNNTYSFGRYFESKRQSVLMSGYLGSIGFGYPAAMGAWAAAPKRPIVAVTGDGGFGQYMAELSTAVKYRMPIKHVLLNNRELGKISKEQLAGGFDVWATDLINPDFATYANTCGALGIRVAKASQLDEALQQAFAHDGPVLIEVITDADLI